MQPVIVGSPKTPAVLPGPSLPDPKWAAEEIFRQLHPGLQQIGQMVNTVFSEADPYHGLLDPIADYGESIQQASKALQEATTVPKLARDATRALQAAPIHMNAMAQAGRDVSRLKREILILEKVVQHRGSQKAAAILPDLKLALVAAESTWQKERTFWNSYRRISTEYGPFGKVKPSLLEKKALALEDVLRKGPVGQKLLQYGKLDSLELKTLGSALTTVGAGVSFVKGVKESAAQTAGGRLVTGALAGAASIMLDRNPLVGLADTAIKETAGEDFTLARFYEGVAHTVSALGEGLLRDDSKPLSLAHERNMRGEHGRVLKLYAKCGDIISKNKQVDGAMSHVADILGGVPADFRNSSSWWGGAALERLLSKD